MGTTAPAPPMVAVARSASFRLVVIDLLIGITFLLGPAKWFTGHAYHDAEEIAPIWVWGLILIALAVVKLVAFGLHEPQWIRTGLLVGAGLWAVFAVLFLASALQQGSSPIAGLLATLSVSTHWALGTGPYLLGSRERD